MCRWFVYLSEKETCLLEDVLVTPKHSICQQVSKRYLPKLWSHHEDDASPGEEDESKLRNSLINMDGFGMAWYTSAKQNFVKDCEGPRPAMFKTTLPPLNDMNFRNLAGNIEANVLFGHIRASSGSAIAQLNNHPFVFGRHVFMHNGTVMDFSDIRREICSMLDRDCFRNVQGSCDSEHLAALYMSYLTNGRGMAAWEEEFDADAMAKALQKAVTTVIETQKKVLGAGARPNSLNLATTDGKRLVTFRFRNHKTQQPPSLYYSTTAGQTLNRKYPGKPEGEVNEGAFKTAQEHPKHIIVASEPTTFDEDEWNLIEKNHALIVDQDGTYKVSKIEYKSNLNVEDPEHEFVHGDKNKP